MNLNGKVIVVTGAAHGIGAALGRRFARENPQAVVLADLDGAGVRNVADEVGGLSMQIDVSHEEQIKSLVDLTLDRFGRIDLFCSNAGIIVDGGLVGDVIASDDDWKRVRDVNVMAHVWAARAVLPGMLARGDGHLLQTVSAAGLLTSLGSVTYAVTKHAALALAEWIAVTHGDAGIKVSAICPQGVRTDMLMRFEGNFLIEGAVTPEAVAEAAVEGIAEERFLILPHPEVAEFFRRKATDYDRWLRGMRRLQKEVNAKKQP